MSRAVREFLDKEGLQTLWKTICNIFVPVENGTLNNPTITGAKIDNSSIDNATSITIKHTDEKSYPVWHKGNYKKVILNNVDSATNKIILTPNCYDIIEQSRKSLIVDIPENGWMSTNTNGEKILNDYFLEFTISNDAVIDPTTNTVSNEAFQFPADLNWVSNSVDTEKPIWIRGQSYQINLLNSVARYYKFIKPDLNKTIFYSVRELKSTKPQESNENRININPDKDAIVQSSLVTGHDYNITNSDGRQGKITFSGDIIELVENSFINQSNIKAITLPDCLSTVGTKSFYKCTNLESFGNLCSADKKTLIINNELVGFAQYDLTEYTIQEGVTTIKESVFEDCTNLTKIIIPNSVTTIEANAFKGCSNLTSVTIGKGITSIASNAFSGCNNITSISIDYNIPNSTFASNKFYGGKIASNASVTIGDSVNTIGNSAFNNCTNLISVTIGDSVATIGNSAFYGCSSLTSVTIGDSVNTIGNSAFRGCSSLTSVTIPDSVTSIGNYAFNNCTNLISVTIGNSVNTIGGYAFGGCNKITRVNISDISAWCKIEFIDGDTSSTTNVTANPLYIGGSLYLNGEIVKDLVIPSDITEIKMMAFRGCTSITSVTVGDSVTVIGNYAFSNCTSITSVTVGDSVTVIGNYAFSNCNAINEIIFKCNILNNTFNANKFYGATLSKEYTVYIGKDDTDANKTLSVGTNAFLNTNNLCNLVINSNLTNGTSLETSTFYNRAFKSITINKLGKVTEGFITRSKPYIFYNCSSEIVTVNCDTSVGSSASIGGSTGGTILPGLGGGLLPGGGSTGGESSTPTFDDTSNDAEKGVFYGSKFNKVIFTDNVKTIGSCAFYGCTTITNIYGGSNINKIESYAFRGCTNLTSRGSYGGFLNFYVGATTSNGNIKQVTIGNYAFSGCENLGLSFAGNCQNIGNGAFYNCNNGNYDIHLEFTYGLNEIGNYAFKNCKNLMLVTIPHNSNNTDNVYTIGNNAFEDCVDLTDFTYQAYVPSGSNNSSYGLKKISDSLFKGCTNLSDIGYYTNNTTYNKGIRIESIGEKAFYNCTKLTTEYVDFAKITNPITIGKSAFSGCSRITTLYIDDYIVNNIGDYAFENCTGLTDVFFNCTNAITMGIGIFKGCTSIEDFINSKLSTRSKYLTAGNYLYAVAWANSNITGTLDLSGTHKSYYGSSSTGYRIIKIKDYACFGDAGITNAIIPSSVDEIGNYAFQNCINLKTVTCKPTSPPDLGEGAFDNCSSSLQIKVNNSTVQDAYEMIPEWNDLNVTT